MTTENGTPIAENIRIAEEAIQQRVKQIQLHHEAEMQNQALSNSDSLMFLKDANNQENQISQESLDNIELDKT